MTIMTIMKDYPLIDFDFLFCMAAGSDRVERRDLFGGRLRQHQQQIPQQVCGTETRTTFWRMTMKVTTWCWFPLILKNLMFLDFYFGIFT